MSQPLAHRIEEASLNAWPALQQMLLDGWLLRFARGFTKRSNSVVPAYPPRAASDGPALLAKIRYCENLYAREQLRTVFRLTSIADSQHSNAALDQALDQRGYRRVDPSLVLSREIQPTTAAVEIALLSLDEWLDVYCTLTDMQPPVKTLHRLILQSIAGECAFAALFHEQQPVACGLAVVEHELVGLFDIFTHQQYRQRGHAQTLVTNLLTWAAQQGARHAYLQVVADNQAARALYTHLGFSECYHYWYRVGN